MMKPKGTTEILLNNYLFGIKGT